MNKKDGFHCFLEAVGDEDNYGLEMSAFLNEEDILRPGESNRPGILRFCTPTAPRASESRDSIASVLQQPVDRISDRQERKRPVKRQLNDTDSSKENERSREGSTWPEIVISSSDENSNDKSDDLPSVPVGGLSSRLAGIDLDIEGISKVDDLAPELSVPVDDGRNQAKAKQCSSSDLERLVSATNTGHLRRECEIVEMKTDPIYGNEATEVAPYPDESGDSREKVQTADLGAKNKPAVESHSVSGLDESFLKKFPMWDPFLSEADTRQFATQKHDREVVDGSERVQTPPSAEEFSKALQYMETRDRLSPVDILDLVDKWEEERASAAALRSTLKNDSAAQNRGKRSVPHASLVVDTVLQQCDVMQQKSQERMNCSLDDTGKWSSSEGLECVDVSQNVLQKNVSSEPTLSNSVETVDPATTPTDKTYSSSMKSIDSRHTRPNIAENFFSDKPRATSSVFGAEDEEMLSEQDVVEDSVEVFDVDSPHTEETGLETMNAPNIYSQKDEEFDTRGYIKGLAERAKVSPKKSEADKFNKDKFLQGLVQKLKRCDKVQSESKERHRNVTGDKEEEQNLSDDIVEISMQSAAQKSIQSNESVSIVPEEARMWVNSSADAEAVNEDLEALPVPWSELNQETQARTVDEEFDDCGVSDSMLAAVQTPGRQDLSSVRCVTPPVTTPKAPRTPQLTFSQALAHVHHSPYSDTSQGFRPSCDDSATLQDALTPGKPVSVSTSAKKIHIRTEDEARRTNVLSASTTPMNQPNTNTTLPISCDVSPHNESKVDEPCFDLDFDLDDDDDVIPPSPPKSRSFNNSSSNLMRKRPDFSGSVVNKKTKTCRKFDGNKDLPFPKLGNKMLGACRSQSEPSLHRNTTSVQQRDFSLDESLQSSRGVNHKISSQISSHIKENSEPPVAVVAPTLSQPFKDFTDLKEFKDDVSVTGEQFESLVEDLDDDDFKDDLFLTQEVKKKEVISEENPDKLYTRDQAEIETIDPTDFYHLDQNDVETVDPNEGIRYFSDCSNDSPVLKLTGANSKCLHLTFTQN